MLTTVRRCLEMLPPGHRTAWAMLVPIALLSGMLEAGAAAAVLGLIRIIGDPGQVTSIPAAAAVARWLPPMSATSLILTFTGLTIAYHVVKNLLLVAAQYFRQHIVARSRAELTLTMLRGYLAAPYIFQLRRNSDDLRRNTSSLPTAVFDVLLSAATLLSEALVAAGLAMVLLWVAPLIAVASGTATVLLMLATMHWTRRRAFAAGQLGHDAAVQSDHVLQQAFGGLKEMDVLRRQHYFNERYAEVQRRLLDLGVLGTTLTAIPPLVIETTFVVGALLVIALITVSGAAGPNGLPLLAVFTYAAFRLIPSINRMTWRVNTIRGSAAPIRELHTDFVALQRFAGRPLTSAPPRTDWQRLSLDRVSFAYEDGRDVLRDISFELRRGETIGVVGATGAGKTTLIDVVLGLLSPSHGSRFVDGRPAGLDEGPRAGYVPQTVFVADDTLARNVAFAVDAADVDTVKLHAAIRAAQLAPLVDTWPAGLNTVLGERGARLSGGERQRVGIARALYHDADLLVLDEATSALDSETEAKVLAAIRALRITTIIVAHRLSTISGCDRLVCIVDGAIAAQGSFDELMRASAPFRQLVEAADIAASERW